MSTYKQSGCISVHCWNWISHEGAGMCHPIEGHLDGLQYKHILQNVMMPCVRMLYPDDIIHFQQDHFSIHDSHVVQESLLEANIELTEWPPRAPDMNPIENMWSEMMRTMQETWHVLPRRNSDELWALVSDGWNEVASSQRHV
jgi:Transposase and inactivated derivatives